MGEGPLELGRRSIRRCPLCEVEPLLLWDGGWCSCGGGGGGGRLAIKGVKGAELVTVGMAVVW